MLTTSTVAVPPTNGHAPAYRPLEPRHVVDPPTAKRRPRGVPVRNTRGQKWGSVKEAALHYGVSVNWMSVLVKENRSVGGWRLMRADPDDGRWRRPKAASESP